MWHGVTILALYILKTREMQRNGLQHSDGVLESTIWEVTVRASFDVCLRRDIGAGGELHQGSQRTGMKERAAANEIQGTKGVGRRGGPQEKSTGSGGPRGRPREERVAGEVTGPCTPTRAPM